MVFVDRTRYQCDHCGELGTGKYCKNCKTAEGRNKIDDENIAIMKENISKGMIYISSYWNRLKIKAGIK